MKKTLITLALLSAGSAQASFTTYMRVGLVSAAERSSFAPAFLSPADATGILDIQTETNGAIFNGGTITGSYQFYGNPGSFGTHINTYTNVTYTLGSTSGTITDFDYNGTGTWLVEYRFGGDWLHLGDGTALDPTRDINAWNKLSQAPSASLRNNSGAAVATTGGMTCVGAGCSNWGSNSLGLEGVILRFNVDQNNGFALLGGDITLMEFTGSAGVLQTQIYGGICNIECTGDNNYQLPSVPVPSSFWLLGSGLLGLMGVKRRNKIS
jgi:hypothetical protein